jgi:threonine dehydratase
VRVTGVSLATGVVFTVNVVVVAFGATVVLAGTVATAVLPLVNVTTAPADGAGPVSVTVPTAETLPMTVAGLRVMELIAGGNTTMVTMAVLDIKPPKLA